MRREYNSVFVPENEYFTIEVVTAGKLIYSRYYTNTVARPLQYSKNGGTWTTITPGTNGVLSACTIQVVAGDKIAFKGNNPEMSSQIGDSCSFCASTCTYKASGNIMSLLAGDDFKNVYSIGSGLNYGDPGMQVFGEFFKNCTGLTDASELALPASASTWRSYYGMFSGCTNMVHGPKEIGLLSLSAAQQCMYCMFDHCTSLVEAPKIKFIEIKGTGNNNGNICQYMFRDCTSLVTPPPELPLQIPSSAVSYIYDRMFAGCSSLVSGPALPSTLLAPYCYYGMFSGCTSLTQAPNLPAQFNQPGYQGGSTSSAYAYMFNSCTSLVNAPIMSGASTGSGSHMYMFVGCTKLKNIQTVLTAHNIFYRAYYHMFEGCSSLTTAPALPATTLLTSTWNGQECYCGMFQGCTSLTTPPVMCATTLAVACYESMFYGCNSLTSAPRLPVTALTNRCYYQMFRDCKNLTTAPVLPAPALAVNSYTYMFTSCSKLNYIKCLASATTSTTLTLTGCTNGWTNSVPSSGTFVKNTNAPISNDRLGWTRNGNGIPANWTVQNATS